MFFINIEMNLMTSKDLFQGYQSLAQDLSHLKKIGLKIIVG